MMSRTASSIAANWRARRSASIASGMAKAFLGTATARAVPIVPMFLSRTSPPIAAPSSRWSSLLFNAWKAACPSLVLSKNNEVSIRFGRTSMLGQMNARPRVEHRHAAERAVPQRGVRVHRVALRPPGIVARGPQPHDAPAQRAPAAVGDGEGHLVLDHPDAPGIGGRGREARTGEDDERRGGRPGPSAPPRLLGRRRAA